MRRRLTLSSVLLLTLLIGLGAVTAAHAAGKWTRVRSQTSGMNELSAVCFVDSTHGWLAAYSRIYATADGGKSWTVQYMDTGQLGADPDNDGVSIVPTSVSFSDKSNGWIVGEGGLILSTTNGGADWTRSHVDGMANFIWDVSSPSAGHACAVGMDGIATTFDGGLHWTSHTQPAFIHGVCLPDATNGWAVGFNGSILTSTDGGATWTPQSSTPAADLFVVSFADATHGLAAGTVAGQNVATMFSTDDGGESWVERPAVSNWWFTFTGVALPDATHGWAVGSDATVLTTVNGGRTWSERPKLLGLDGVLLDVSFPDARHGWAITHADSNLPGVSEGVVLRYHAAPRITGLNPAKGRMGCLLTITGTDFNPRRGKSTVKIGTKVLRTYASWSDGRVRVRVPATVSGRKSVTITVEGQKSNVKYFRVL